MAREYEGRVEFVFVYIREAHAADEWEMGGKRVGVCPVQPKTLEERAALAREMKAALHLTVPIVVDDVDDTVSKAYGAWPDRLYVIGRDGRVVFQGAYGPFGFKPAEVRAFLERAAP